ncbi:MAG TPA: CoA pyrophosphatase [Gemmatimonadales bacterium]|nr:CoA pyrophosphatase [Gemmatimonadales bacterium]
MSLAYPLTTRLDRLRSRLAGHRPAGGEDAGLIWAAVSLVVVPSPDAVLLIRRAERAGDPWSGHMALPGGHRDPSDPDLLETAVRETLEEVGLTLQRDDLLGTLDDVVPRTPVLPPVAVRPFVFFLSARPPLTLNPEVAAARWVLLDHLLHPATYHSARIEVRGESREFPAYRVEETIVWGMTERILTDLLALLR